MAHETAPKVYQLHVWIRPISPMIGRRILVRSDSSLADLHATIQIAFAWSDTHLHRFRIHGRDYGLSRVGGPGFAHDARTLRLDSFQFRRNERFLYEYDLRNSRQHQVRVERQLAAEPKRTYPVCVGGQRAAPPQDWGGPWASLERRDSIPFRVYEHLEQLAESAEADDLDSVQDHLEAIETLRDGLTQDRFDRRRVNRRLQLYAAGDERW